MAGMAFKGGLSGIFIGLFGLPFFVVTLLSGMALIYLPLNSLNVNISPGKISVLRSLLFIPVYRRVMQRNEISGLSIKRSGSTGQGVTKVEHFKLLAKHKNGQTVTIAEDLDGQNVASHFRDYIAQRISVDVE